jgi:predicted Zn-dependent peptidase
MSETELIKINNGLSIISCAMPNMRSVSTVIGIRAGSIYEEHAQRGISHFIEHMLFKGTKNRKNTLEISQCIEELGGEINASTSEEYTFLYSKVLNNNFASAFEVMHDILNHSLFREEDIMHEKSVVIEEINKYQDIPEDWIGFLINQLLWKDTVLGQNVLGEKETVRELNRAKILQYFHKIYQPKNMVISITGNVSLETVKEVIKNLPFIPKETIRENVPKIYFKEQIAPELLVTPKKVNQTHLCFGFEGVSRFHPEKITMDLLNIILGAGLSSRLFQEIRVKEGLAYDIHSYSQYFNETGSFNIYSGVDPGKLNRSIETILKELKKLKNDKMGTKELQKAKEMYKGSILLGLESTLSHAFRMGSYLLLYKKEYQYRELIEKIENVQPEDIRKLAQEIFLSRKINLVIFYPNDIKIDQNKLLDKLEV